LIVAKTTSSVIVILEPMKSEKQFPIVCHHKNKKMAPTQMESWKVAVIGSAAVGKSSV